MLASITILNYNNNTMMLYNITFYTLNQLLLRTLNS